MHTNSAEMRGMYILIMDDNVFITRHAVFLIRPL